MDETKLTKKDKEELLEPAEEFTKPKQHGLKTISDLFNTAEMFGEVTVTYNGVPYLIKSLLKEI